MNELVFVNNNKVVTSSLKVAEFFGKKHQHVIRDIEKLIERGVSNFGPSSYISPKNGQEYKCYEMDRDGFTLLAMGFTGKKALEFKLQYIAAFNAMEAELLKQKQRYSFDFGEFVKSSINEIVVALNSIATNPDGVRAINVKFIHDEHSAGQLQITMKPKKLPAKPRKALSPNRLAYQKREIIILFLNALLKGYGVDHGIYVKLDKEGRPNFTVPTGELMAVFRKIGERHDFPNFPYSSSEFGTLFGNSNSTFAKQGWSREEVKITRGTRYYQYTYSNPTFDDM